MIERTSLHHSAEAVPSIDRDRGNGKVDYTKFLVKGFAKRYLSTYFRSIDSDEKAIADFLVREYRKIGGMPPMLEIGCGPGVQHVLPAVPYVSSINMADFLPDNLSELQKWKCRHMESHDWRHFTKHILELEGGKPSMQEIEEREDALRGKLGKIMHADVLQEQPLGHPTQYPAVGFFYCAEAVTRDRTQWAKVMERVAHLVSSRGLLFMSSLRNAKYYTIENGNGPEFIPCATVNECDFREVLPAVGFDMQSSTIERATVPDMAEHGINEILLVSARKKA